MIRVRPALEQMPRVRARPVSRVGRREVRHRTTSSSSRRTRRRSGHCRRARRHRGRRVRCEPLSRRRQRGADRGPGRSVRRRPGAGAARRGLGRACRLAFATTIDPGDEVVFGWPSFEAYPILAMQVGARITQVPLVDAPPRPRRHGGARHRSTRLVFVCNPEQPDGHRRVIATRSSASSRVCRRRAGRARRGLPRVRHRRADHPDGIEVLARTRERRRAPHLLEGLRARGAPRRLCDRHARGDRRAAEAARALRGERARAGRGARVARRGDRDARHGSPRWSPSAPASPRSSRRSDCRSCGRRPTSCGSPVPENAAALGAYAERAGVVLRPFPGVGVRITVGAPTENDRVVKVLRAALEDGVLG